MAHPEHDPERLDGLQSEHEAILAQLDHEPDNPALLSKLAAVDLHIRGALQPAAGASGRGWAVIFVTANP